MGILKRCKNSCINHLFGGGKNTSAGLVGSPLEKVLSTAGGEDKYVIYRLVSHKHGGLLVDLFQKRGLKEVERYMRYELSQYLYEEGRGQIVTLSDYLRWKTTVGSATEDRSTPVDLTVESVMVAMHRPDPFNKFEEHETCWKLEHRGALGETLLHLLITCDTPMHTKMAKVLLELYPKMALDVVEGLEYFGTSALHLAVAYNNMPLVSVLIECGSDVNRRATGRFFLPTDQQLGPRKGTDYSGLSYLGEYALSWAACAENEAAYNMLLDSGSDPNLQDSLGNMVLHMVVIADKLDMYSYALRHPKRPANNEIVNKAGLTPLALACTLGRDEIFREMLELSSVEFWRYSNITCSAYPLSALDTILPDGRTNWKSALMIILNGETDEHLDMLGSGVVQRLLEDKWKTFARKQFLFRLALLFLHLFVLSIGVYLRPRTNESLFGAVDIKSVIRYCAELATCGGCAMFVLVQQGGEIRSQGLLAFVYSLTRAPPKLIFLISNILILICIPLRLLSMRSIEDTLLMFAVPGSWFFLMFFAGAVRLTGPFVTMIYSMISGDMVRFGIIYFVVLLGFSQVFYFLFKSCHRGGVKCKDDDSSIQIYGTYFGTWMALYQMTLGNHQYQDFSLPEYSTLSLVVFVIFMVMVPILLLNMLTAMMGNTYSTIISKSEKEFFKQWAKIVLTQERAVSPANAAVYLDQYAINLAPSSVDGELQKGLVVIKEKSKTKARQRKGALLNWKKIGKKAIKEMRTHGCTGNLLLEKVAEANERKAARRPAPGKGRVLEHCNIESSSSSSDDEEATAAAAAREGLGEAIAQMAWHHDIDLEAGGQSPNPPKVIAPTVPPPRKALKKTSMKKVAELRTLAFKTDVPATCQVNVEPASPDLEEMEKNAKWRERALWVTKVDGIVREVQRQMETEDDAGELVAREDLAQQCKVDKGILKGEVVTVVNKDAMDKFVGDLRKMVEKEQDKEQDIGKERHVGHEKEAIDSEKRIGDQERGKDLGKTVVDQEAEMDLGNDVEEVVKDADCMEKKMGEEMEKKEEVMEKKILDVEGLDDRTKLEKRKDEIVQQKIGKLGKKLDDETLKKLEEGAAKKLEEETAKKKLEVELAKKSEEETMKKLEEVTKKELEEEVTKKGLAEKTRQKLEEEISKKKPEEEVPKKKPEEEVSTKELEEEVSKKKLEEEVSKKKLEEEIAKKSLEQIESRRLEETTCNKLEIEERERQEEKERKEVEELNRSKHALIPLTKGLESASTIEESQPKIVPSCSRGPLASFTPRTHLAGSDSNSGEDSDTRRGPLLLPPISKQKRRKQRRGSLKGRGQVQVPPVSPCPSPSPSSKPLPWKRIRGRHNKVGVSDGSPSSTEVPESAGRRLCPERPRTAHMISPAAWSTAPVRPLSSLLARQDLSGSDDLS